VDEFDEFWGYVQIDLGCGCGDDRPLSADCLAVCAPGAPALCDKDWCRCQCHQDDDAVAHARDHDDRPLCQVNVPNTGKLCRRHAGHAGSHSLYPGPSATVDPVRARELDDRDHDQLAAVARDLEQERRPDLDGLLRERYGRPTRGAA
jgi:hypothetical protein